MVFKWQHPAESRGAAMPVALVVVKGRSEGTKIPVATSPFLIGRDPRCHLRPRSSLVSKWHCVLSLKEDGVYLRDLNSLNGTFVNNRRIRREIKLRNGDLIAIGPLVFAVAIEEPVSAPAQEPQTADLEQAVAQWIGAGDGVGPENEEALAESTTIMPSPVAEQPPSEPIHHQDPAGAPSSAEASASQERKSSPKTGSTAEVADKLLELLFEPRRRS